MLNVADISERNTIMQNTVTEFTPKVAEHANKLEKGKIVLNVTKIQRRFSNMEIKTILAIGLILFIIGGIVFLQIRKKRK